MEELLRKCMETRNKLEALKLEIDIMLAESQAFIMAEAQRFGMKSFKILEAQIDWSKTGMLSLLKFVYLYDVAEEDVETVEVFKTQINISLVVRGIGAKFVDVAEMGGCDCGECGGGHGEGGLN